MGRWNEAEDRLDMGLGELLALCLPPPPSGASPVGAGLGDELGRRSHRLRRERLADAVALECERPVTWEPEIDGIRVHVHGRIDFLHRLDDALVVEECKSVVEDPDAIPDALRERARHQLAFYVLALRDEFARRGVDETLLPRLLWMDLRDGACHAEELALDLAATERRFRKALTRFLDRRNRRRREQAERAETAESLPFPHAAFRPGQEEMIAAMEETLRRGDRLLLEAPTGTGKTAAGLWVALRAACRWGLTAFFLTGRNAQRKLARELLEEIAAKAPLPFFALILASRGSLCPRPGAGCEACPLGEAAAESTRLGRAVDALVARRLVGPTEIAAAGRTHGLCPFELALAAAEEAQLVVADQNYAFDPRVHLRRFFRDGRPEELVLVVDEVHGLPARLLDGLTREVSLRPVQDLAGRFRGLTYPAHRPLLADGFDELLALLEGRRGTRLAPPDGTASDEDWFPLDLESTELRRALKALRPALADEALFRWEEGIADEEEELSAFLASWTGLVQIAEDLDEAAAFFLVERPLAPPCLRLLCLDGAPWLRRRWERVHAVVAMSATLSPASYFRRALALDGPRDELLCLPGPFPPENLLVLVDPSVDDRARAREQAIPEAARRIAAIVEAHRGRHLAFVPSYAVARRIAAALPARSFETFVQEEGEDAAETEALLGRFLADGDGPVHRLLLAITGGRLAEGVDFPGEACEGVILFGPAIPPPSLEGDCRLRWHASRAPEAWLRCVAHPAAARLVQAAGRMIRRPDDRGVVVLLGKRFAEEPWIDLLPESWHGGSPRDLVDPDPVETIRRFWNEAPRR